MRLLDLILAILVLLFLISVAELEFPGYESRAIPRPAAASPAPSPAPQ